MGVFKASLGARGWVGLVLFATHGVAELDPALFSCLVVYE